MNSGWIGAAAGAIVAFCAFLGISLRHEHRLTKNEENIKNVIETMRDSTAGDREWKVRMEKMMNDQTAILSELLGYRKAEHDQREKRHV